MDNIDISFKDYIALSIKEDVGFYHHLVRHHVRFPKLLRLLLDNQPTTVSDEDISRLLYDHFSSGQLMEKEDYPYYQKYSIYYTNKQKSMIKIHNIDNRDVPELLDKSFINPTEMWTEIGKVIDSKIKYGDETHSAVQRLCKILTDNSEWVLKAAQNNNSRYNKVLESLVTNVNITGDECIRLLKLLSFDKIDFSPSLTAVTVLFNSAYRYNVMQAMFDYNGVDVFDYFNKLDLVSHNANLKLDLVIQKAQIKNIRQDSFNGFSIAVNQVKKILDECNGLVINDFKRLGLLKENVNNKLLSDNERALFLGLLRQAVKENKFSQLSEYKNIEDVMLINYVKLSSLKNTNINERILDEVLVSYNTYIECEILKSTSENVNHDVMKRKLKV